MPVKNGDLVKRIRGFNPQTHPWFTKPALVVSKPYEDQIHLTDVPMRVVDICIVVDLMIDNRIHKGIPVSELSRIVGER